MKQFVPELWFWLTIALALGFVYSFGERWAQTMGYSKGHRIIGLLAVASCLLTVVVMAFARKFAYVFAPGSFAGLWIWLYYNNRFNTRYPVPASSLKPESEGMIEPKKLFDYLANPEKQEQTFVVRNFRMIALSGCVVFAFVFGFNRVVHYIHEGDKRVAEAKKETQVVVKAAVKQAVSEAKKETQAVVRQAVDTLQSGQNEANARADTALRKANDLEKKVDKNAEGVDKANQRARRAEAKANRPAIIVNPAPAPGFRKMGKSFGANAPEYPDTTSYAKNF